MTTSPWAQAARLIRAELKSAFPTIRFSVTSEVFGGGDAVRIRWTGGPTYKDVAAIVNKYEQGHFNALTDGYEYNNRRDDIPQVKFVSLRRREAA